MHFMNQPQFEEERDDAIVGRAFVWSALVIVIVGSIGAAAYWRLTLKPTPVVKVTPPQPPAVRERSKIEIPAMPFVDITESAGILFTHDNGAAGEKLLPE